MVKLPWPSVVPVATWLPIAPFVTPYAVTVASATGPLTAVPLMIPLPAAGVVPFPLPLPPPPQPLRSVSEPIKRVRASITLSFLCLCIEYILHEFYFYCNCESDEAPAKRLQITSPRVISEPHQFLNTPTYDNNRFKSVLSLIDG